MLNFRNKSVIFLLLFSCIIIAPVYAQDTDVTPTPLPSTRTILTEVSDSVNAIGIANFIYAGIIIFFVIIAWKGLTPLLKANSNANDRAAEANDRAAKAQEKLIDYIEKRERDFEKVNEIRRLQAESMERIAITQESTAKFMSEIETRKEAAERSNTQVEAIKSHASTEASGIKSHIETQVGDLKTAVQQAVIGIGEIKDEIANAVKKDDLEEILKPLLKPVIDKLDLIAEQLSTAREDASSTTIPVVQTSVEIVETKEETKDA